MGWTGEIVCDMPCDYCILITETILYVEFKRVIADCILYSQMQFHSVSKLIIERDLVPVFKNKKK